MRTKMLATLLLGLGAGRCVPVGAEEVPAADFYVAVDGRDDNAGTADRPFATLARARDAVRKKVAAGLKADVTVRIRGGMYFLAAPVVFGPEDSGTQKHSITYMNWGAGMPTFSGGREITGWKKGEGRLWTVRLPEVKAGKWFFRQLFVGRRRATRARTPNASSHKDYCYRLAGASISKDLKRHTLTLPAGALKNWANLGDVEAVVLKNWANLRKRILSVDPASGLVVLKPPHVKYSGGNRPRKGGGCFFENAREFLDSPGEWYLDRQSGVLTYWPRDREDMNVVRKIAPVLTHVLEIAGRPDAPVRNLHFHGLSFAHNHLPLPPEGHHGRQAAFRYGGKGMPGAIRWMHAVQCSLVGCQVAHIGGSAIDLREGCCHNRIEGNAVFDVEGNGINLGGPNNEALVPKSNRIANNYVRFCGQIYYGACAIWVGFAQKTAIEHNRVCELPYTGISIGWRWNAEPSVAREYIVAYNHVYNVMKQVCDGGAIYSLGFQPGTVIRGNYLHDVRRSRYAIAAPNNGIFLDEGSKGFLIEDNVIYRTAGKPVRHNQNSPRWHTWRNNVLVPGGKDKPADLTRVKTAGLEPKWAKRLLPQPRVSR